MTLADVVLGAQWVFLAYFVGINLGYLSQNVIATMGIRRYLQTADQFLRIIEEAATDAR